MTARRPRLSGATGRSIGCAGPGLTRAPASRPSLVAPSTDDGSSRPNDTSVRITRRYIDGSLILVTVFETASGIVELVDFMPPYDSSADLVRLVRGVRGHIDLHTEFILRFDYGSIVPWVERLDGKGLRAIAGPEMAVLRTSVPLRVATSRRSASSPSAPVKLYRSS